MRNTFSWPCASCGEYNVIDLGGQAGSRPRCGFCFHPVQSIPSLTDETPMNAPPVILSDAWIGDGVIRPFFASGARLETPGLPSRPLRGSRGAQHRSASAPRR